MATNAAEINYVPVTAEQNVETLVEAVSDVQEFFQCGRVSESRVYDRYNVLSEDRDDVRFLDLERFRELVQTAHNDGDVCANPFGITLVDVEGE